VLYSFEDYNHGIAVGHIALAAVAVPAIQEITVEPTEKGVPEYLVKFV
jgi:hypothetical protein